MDRKRTVVNWGAWILAVAGVAVELVGIRSTSLFGGKSILVGSFMVLIGILIIVLVRRKASV